MKIRKSRSVRRRFWIIYENKFCSAARIDACLLWSSNSIKWEKKKNYEYRTKYAKYKTTVHKQRVTVVNIGGSSRIQLSHVSAQECLGYNSLAVGCFRSNKCRGIRCEGRRVLWNVLPIFQSIHKYDAQRNWFKYIAVWEFRRHWRQYQPKGQRSKELQMELELRSADAYLHTRLLQVFIKIHFHIQCHLEYDI